MMEHHEKHETSSFMPVIPRLDRLDRMLQLLEESHSLSRRELSTTVEDDHHHECKSLSSAMEDVQHKGTVMERLSMLENRVLQLCLEMDEENTSKSSSSTVQVPQGITKDSEPYVNKGHDENEIITTHEKKDRRVIQDGVSVTPKESLQENKKRHKKKTNKKWLGLFRFRMRC